MIQSFKYQRSKTFGCKDIKLENRSLAGKHLYNFVLDALTITAASDTLGELVIFNLIM